MHTPYGLEVVDDCRNCTLKSEGYFCELSAPSLKGFDAVKHAASYPQGAILFVQGEPPRGVFVLCKGRVKLTVTSREGKTLILRIARPGEVLGLHGAVSGTAYQATAETLEPSQVVFIRRDNFLRFLREHGEASLHAAQQLSSIYQTACDQIRSLALSHSAPEKLARFLLDWSGDGQQTRHGIRVKLALTHEEIGQLIGASRETVTRTLGDFRNRQIASLSGSTLLIQNKTALETFMVS